eukprot:1680285-Pyramimonas_sp.AAC.1
MRSEGPVRAAPPGASRPARVAHIEQRNCVRALTWRPTCRTMRVGEPGGARRAASCAGADLASYQPHDESYLVQVAHVEQRHVRALAHLAGLPLVEGGVDHRVDEDRPLVALLRLLHRLHHRPPQLRASKQTNKQTNKQTKIGNAGSRQHARVHLNRAIDARVHLNRAIDATCVLS